MCKKAGFLRAYSTIRRAVVGTDDAYRLPRICVTPAMSTAVIAGLLNQVFWPETVIRSLAEVVGRR